MLKLFRILSLPMLAVSAITVQAASFNCQKAATFVEKAVCQNDSLSALDDELNTVFNDALNNSADPKGLKKQEITWLKAKRNRCQTNACLEKAYKERIVALSNVDSKLESGKANNTGEYIRYDANGKADSHAASITIFSLAKSKVKIEGSSTWVGDQATGNVHTGEVNGTFDLQGDQVHYQDESGCAFMLLIGKDALTVNNDNGQCGGANVTFNGYYKKMK